MKKPKTTLAEILANPKTAYSVTQVAQACQCPRNTVLQWIHNGVIKAYRIGTKWYVFGSAIKSAMKGN